MYTHTCVFICSQAHAYSHIHETFDVHISILSVRNDLYNPRYLLNLPVKKIFILRNHPVFFFTYAKQEFSKKQQSTESAPTKRNAPGKCYVVASKLIGFKMYFSISNYIRIILKKYLLTWLHRQNSEHYV